MARKVEGVFGMDSGVAQANEGMLRTPRDQRPGAPVAALIVGGIVTIVALFVVGNLGPPTIDWEPTAVVPAKAHVVEGPGPEHCDQQDQTFLNVFGGKYVAETWGGRPLRFIASTETATLPPNAQFTGWHSGERELWVDPASSPPDAVYVVSPSGVERWARYDVWCI